MSDSNQITKASFGHDTILAQSESVRTMGLGGTFALWLGANFVINTMFTGLFLVPDLSFWSAMLAVLIGSLVGAIPLVLMATTGFYSGSPTMVVTDESQTLDAPGLPCHAHRGRG